MGELIDKAKAIEIASRYCHWSGYPNDDENFKVFYREEYLKMSSK